MMVSVIIVTIGAKDYTQLCLNSLLEQTYIPFEIIVMDNSSKPNFSQELSQLYPSVKIYSSANNLFYAGALNRGIKLSRGEFTLCLNDDVVLDRKFIQEGLAGFSVKDRIGLVSGKVLRSNGKILDSTGLFLTLSRTAKDRGYGRLDLKRFEKPGFIFGVNGAAVFYRKKMLDEIKEEEGYFDSRFHMFYEDLDISWRAKRKGWFAYYTPAAVAYHVRGGSFRPDSGIDKAIARRYLNEQLHYELIKNRYLTILKNETFLGFFLHLIPILIYDLYIWACILFFQPKFIKFIFAKIKKTRGVS